MEIFEKNLFPGGRCGQITRDGFRFDTGATMMLMPEVYRDVFRSMGLEMEEELDVGTMNELYTLCFDDGSRLDFTVDHEYLGEQLEKFEKGSSVRAKEYIREGYELYRLGFGRLLGRNFYNLFDFINLRNALLLLKLKVFTTHSRYTRRFFRDPRLQMAFTFQNIYVGQSPFSAPALFSMIPAAELTEGTLFPRGGMYTLTERLLKIAERHGVRVHTGRPVTAIITGKDRARGFAFTDSTTAEADIVIANADLPYVYRELLPRSFKSRRLEKMKYSCSAMLFHWGVDKVYPQLSHHTIFLSDSFREGLQSIFRDRTVGSDPCFYVHAPVRTDPSAAPDGCDSLSVMVGVGHVDSSNRDKWQELQQQVRQSVINKLKSAGMADIERNIRFEIVCDPVNWESSVNISRGSVFGSIGHNIFQMGYFRPHNRDAKYRNLYFTGGSTHPGNGIPMVLLSARLVSERILKEFAD